MQLAAPVIEDIGRQLGAVDRHFRNKFPAYAEDILQEAWTAALDAAPRYRRDDPGARGYFYTVAVRHVAPMINQWIAVTSLPRHMAQAGEGATQYRAEVVDETCGAPAPDAWIPVREAQVRVARLRVKWRRLVDRATASMTDEERHVGLLYVGADGDSRTTVQIWRETGLGRERVKTTVAAFKRLLRADPRIAPMWDEIQRTEEELP
jgi:DNA-directed RNA polymerase specialized sigma24 family protein